MKLTTSSLLAALAFSSIAYAAKAPNGKEFPAHWGDPPKIQTRDLRPLPGGYGRGSGTLAKWIKSNLEKDVAKRGRGDADGWTTLFDAETKTLEGWTVKSGFADYQIKDGTILGTTAEGSGNSFLCTDKKYGDFELEFEVKCHNSLNSGVQIRSQLKNPEGKYGGRVNGPQIEIEASGKGAAEAGYIYGEAAGGWLTPKERRKPHKQFKDGEWNKYRVVAQGARIQTWINGEPIEDLTHEGIYETHAKGLIGLQVHGVGKKAGPFSVQWRNIRIKRIGGGAGERDKAPREVKAKRAPKPQANAQKPLAQLVPGKPGHVYSPFENNREIDVSGIPQGAEVRCPYSGKIFIIP